MVGCSSQSQMSEAEQLQNQALYQQAEQALNDKSFVLEADRVVFRRGRTAFVSSNTNFVSLDGDNATVQIALNGPYSGPNGIGGITVEGIASNVRMNKSRRGNISFSMNVMGRGISAQVDIEVFKGSNSATVTVNPNFNSNRVTLSGQLVPKEASSVFKARSL